MSIEVYENMIKMVSEENVLLREPMSKHTTFRVGGEAAVFISVASKEELEKLIPYFNRLNISYFVIGNGSNLLVSDKGYEGVILQVADKMAEVSVQDTEIIVQAGALLSKVANAACENSLQGMEFAAGIPGSIGGAVVMNAGAYDGEMKDVVSLVRVMDSEGNILELSNGDMEFGYRTSAIKNRAFVVVEVVLKLHKGKKEEIQAKMKDFAERRREKQPLNYPSAGSTFKRPKGHFAGKLIMDAGMRGFRIGGAQVSEKHCGFVVNVGNATASDIWEVMQEVKQGVEDRFGVRLEPEVICLGEF